MHGGPDEEIERTQRDMVSLVEEESSMLQKSQPVREMRQKQKKTRSTEIKKYTVDYANCKQNRRRSIFITVIVKVVQQA